MSPRKDLTPASLRGRKPKVRVVEENDRVKVIWWQHGKRQYQTYPATPAARAEARAFAEGLHATLTAPPLPVRLTTRELWRRYLEAESGSIRPRTRALYIWRWRKWELFIGADTIAEDVSAEAVARFRTTMSRMHAIAQVQSFIVTVKLVYNWADRLELIQRNRIARYRFKRGKDESVNEPAEYQATNLEPMLGALGGGQDGRRWKAWAAVMIAGSQGERINAVLQLEWPDVDFAGGRIRWRAATNKQGHERWQPMTWEALSALLTARTWADRRATNPSLALTRRVAPGRFVFPSGGLRTDRRYTYQAAYLLLVEAERAAGVPHLRWRAFHGFRKMVAGNVAEATGNPWLALQWIGDRDPARMRQYVKERPAELERAAESATGLPHGPAVMDEDNLVGCGAGETWNKASGENRTHDRTQGSDSDNPPKPLADQELTPESGPTKTPEPRPNDSPALPHQCHTDPEVWE